MAYDQKVDDCFKNMTTLRVALPNFSEPEVYRNPFISYQIQ